MKLCVIASRWLAGLTLASLAWWASAATTMTPDKVRSWVYSIPIGPNWPSFSATIAASPFDLVIFGGGLPAPINRAQADPGNNKILVGYISTNEAASYAEPSLFSGTTPSSPILGKPIPGYVDLYSVQYWDPTWQALIMQQVDGWIDAGADGVFLDELSDDFYWLPGNPLGNTPYANATAAMAAFVQNIRAHVASRNLSRPFYIIGNNPVTVAQSFPQAMSSFDMVTNETLYWRQPPSDGLTSVYIGTADAAWIQSTLSKLYSGTLVLGNDYPNPLSNYAEDLKSFQFYNDLGWLPSVTHAFQDDRVFSSGPFMFVARPNNPAVTGVKNKVNFLSGGSALSATLTGGDAGDYFLGGPGQNTINGGAGNDTIYAHPASAALKNQLNLQFVSGGVNATTPAKVQVFVNGQPATGVVAVTQNYNNANYTLQAVRVDTSSYASVLSVEVRAQDLYYQDSNHFNNVFLMGMSYCGAPVDLSKASVSQYSQYLGDQGTILLNSGGVATLPGSALPACTYPSNTSSTIDAGAGTNTVVYRANYSNYSIVRQPDGSWVVTSKSTAEGPDTLRRVQALQFADTTVSLSGNPPLSSACVFAYARANFPDLFAGSQVLGNYQQYEYASFPQTGNFLAVDQTSGIWALGPFTGGAILFVGMQSQFKPDVDAWAAGHGGCQ